MGFSKKQKEMIKKIFVENRFRDDIDYYEVYDMLDDDDKEDIKKGGN